jgi:hypothetical protein
MEASESGQRGGRVLLIDDDLALGGHMTRVLRERGGELVAKVAALVEARWRRFEDPAVLASRQD